MTASVTSMVALALLLAATIPATSAAADWSQLGADAGHSYDQPVETLIGVDSVRSLSRGWRNDVVPPRYEEIPGGPAIRDGVVYAVDAAGGRLEDAVALVTSDRHRRMGRRPRDHRVRV
jgi:hypothetical protein